MSSSSDSPLTFAGGDRFAIRRKLGEGGMGVVYEAYDRLHEMPVALKTLRRTDAATLYRFKKEFRSLVEVSHPNLVTLHEFFSNGDDWFFTMELVDGVNFLEHLRQAAEPAASTAVEDLPDTLNIAANPRTGPESTARHRLSAEDIETLRAVLEQLAEGVCALHRAGKLHRDLKPSNVLVTRDGRVVICDFGLVMDAVPRGPYQTVEEQPIGTVAYMSPEQAANLPLAEASDWYGVGVVLYQALTQRLPFTGDQDLVLRDKQLMECPAPAEVARGIPDDLNDLCVGLLRCNPQHRPTGRQVLERLGRAPAARWAAASLMQSRHARSFVGRKLALAALRAAFDASRDGGTVVLLRGGAGMGKTEVARRFLDELSARDAAVVLAGRCYESESVPYKALDSLVDALSAYLMHLPRRDSDALLPSGVQALARLFPVLRRVEAVADTTFRADAIDPQTLRQRAFAAMRELLKRLAERRPLVLFIDDLQWGDSDSAVLLGALLRRPGAPKLLLVGCYRSEETKSSAMLRALLPADHASSPLGEIRQLDVEALSPEEAADLVLALLARDDPAARARADVIARESGGNPLFVHELVAHLETSAPEAFQPGTLSLHKVIAARLALLSESAREIIRIVAVAARPVPLRVVRQAIGDAPEREALVELRADRFVRFRSTADHDEVEISYDSIREAVLASFSPHEKRRYHLRLAMAMHASGMEDPEALVEHFFVAGEVERAKQYAAGAAQQAADALAFDRAARLYRLLLDLGPEPEKERMLKTRLGDSLANAGRGAEAAAVYLGALEGAQAAEVLELRRRAAEQLLCSGHFDEGVAALRDVLAAVGMKMPRTPRGALWRLLARRALLRLRGLGYRKRDPSQVRADALARIDVCWSVSTGLALVDTVRGADFQTRHLLLALRAGEAQRLLRALVLEACYLAAAGGRSAKRTARARAAAQKLGRSLGDPSSEARIAAAVGVGECLSGHWRNGFQHCERADAIFRDRASVLVWERSSMQLFALWSLHYLGEWGELARRVPLLLGEAVERGNRYSATNLRIGFPNLAWLVVDDVDTARRQLAEAVHRWSHAGFHVQHYHHMLAQSHIELYAGNGGAAWEQISAGWQIMERSLFLRHVQNARIEASYLRARCALAAAGPAGSPDLLRLASRDARRIEREKMTWGVPMAWLIRAGIAARRANAAAAAQLLESAAEGFDAVDLALHATVARRRLGQLLGGEHGGSLLREADEWLQNRGIQNPARVADLVAPGFAG